MEIRPAQQDELPCLQAIEVASGEPFRRYGMPEIADDDPMPLHDLAHARVWVATVPPTADPELVAWIAAQIVDGRAHIEQVSVHPNHARRGIGARLIDRVETWARANGLAGLTLTTFRDIPWNAPYYQRLGFEEITDPAPGLAAIATAETERGLDPDQRVCMGRELRPPANGNDG